MDISYLQDTRDILIQPVASFERIKSYSLSRSYRQYVMLLICYSVISGIVSVISGFYKISTDRDQFSSIPFFGPMLQSWSDAFRIVLIDLNLLAIYGIFFILLFLVFLAGFSLHIFVILLDEGKGVTQTLRTVLSAATPFFLIGWIPSIGLIGIVWMIILCIIGIKTLHEIPWWKAVLSVFLPLVLVATGFTVLFLVVMNVLGNFPFLQ